MISPKDSISETSLKQHLNAKDLIKSIRDIDYQINLKSSTPLITNLRINQTFKDEAKEEGASIIDLVLLALWLLREDIQMVIDSIEPAKPQDKGQPSYIKVQYIKTWERGNIYDILIY